jgi:hypothetical protein
MCTCYEGFRDHDDDDDDSENTTATTTTTTTMITSTTAILYLQRLSLSNIGRSLQNCTFSMVYLTTLSVA